MTPTCDQTSQTSTSASSGIDTSPRLRNGHCSGSDLLRWFGLPELVSASSEHISLQTRRVHAGLPLVLEGQVFERLYLVVSGSFKCVQTDLEGYELVLSFANHGDLIGLDGLGGAEHRSGAVALEDATVALLPAHQLLSLGERLPALVTLLRQAVGAELARCGDTQYLMSAPSSEVRVVRFLLQFAKRQAALGHSERRLHMCMNRREIASYLGLAHETVSRALTALAKAGCIRVSQRDIELIDPLALTDMQRVTRGQAPRQRPALGIRSARIGARVPSAGQLSPTARQ